MRTGDEVTYTSNVHKEYAGQKAIMMEFNLEQRMVNLQFADGNLLWVFWDEINTEN